MSAVLYRVNRFLNLSIFTLNDFHVLIFSYKIQLSLRENSTQNTHFSTNEILLKLTTKVHKANSRKYQTTILIRISRQKEKLARSCDKSKITFHTKMKGLKNITQSDIFSFPPKHTSEINLLHLGRVYFLPRG